jgi:hypothetical protein
LAGWLTFIAAMYLGFFALPITAAALGRVPRLVRSTPLSAWVAVCAWGAVLVAGLAVSEQRPGPPRMPYVPQYLNPWQLGLPDILGGRPWLFADRRILDWVTGLCAAGSLLLVLVLARQLGAAPTPARAAAALTLMVGLWQGVGVLPPSYHFRTWAISMDRYLLPLLPFAVCLGLWAVRDVRLPLPAAWLVVAAFAAFAVAGTRDHLVFQEATWDLARHANRLGVANERLDAGPAWDGYHLWESSDASCLPPRTPNGPWWVYLFAPATDSSYVVATALQGGYDEVARVEYSSWLLRQPAYLYLLGLLDRLVDRDAAAGAGGAAARVGAGDPGRGGGDRAGRGADRPGGRAAAAGGGDGRGRVLPGGAGRVGVRRQPVQPAAGDHAGATAGASGGGAAGGDPGGGPAGGAAGRGAGAGVRLVQPGAGAARDANPGGRGPDRVMGRSAAAAPEQPMHAGSLLLWSSHWVSRRGDVGTGPCRAHECSRRSSARAVDCR